MTVEIIDVSSYQPGVIWSRVATRCGAGVTKATEGMNVRDVYRTYNLRGMKAANMVRLAYHFARPREGASVSGAHAQAQFYLDAISGLDVQIHALDMEDTSAAGLGSYALDEWAEAWCDYVAQKTGQPVWFYSFTSYIVDTMRGAPRTLAKYPLWLAAVGRSTAPGRTSGHQWICWQYSWSGWMDGVSTSNLDHDVYAGTIEQLRAYAAGGHVNPGPIPNPTPVTRKERDVLAYPTGHPKAIFLCGGGFKHRVLSPADVAAYEKVYGAPIQLSISELNTYIDGPTYASVINDDTTRLRMLMQHAGLAIPGKVNSK